MTVPLKPEIEIEFEKQCSACKGAGFVLDMDLNEWRLNWLCGYFDGQGDHANRTSMAQRHAGPPPVPAMIACEYCDGKRTHLTSLGEKLVKAVRRHMAPSL